MIDAAALAWRADDGAVARAAAVRVTTGEIAALDDSASAGALLRVLATLVRPLEGRLSIDGIDAVRAPLEARRRLAYVAPALPLPEGLAVGEYLEFLADTRRQPRERAAAAAARFGLDLRRRLDALTRAERQRARLAAAASTGSRIILLDRPGDDLDLAGRDMATTWLLEECAAGAAVLIARAGALAGLPLRALTPGEAVA